MSKCSGGNECPSSTSLQSLLYPDMSPEWLDSSRSRHRQRCRPGYLPRLAAEVGTIFYLRKAGEAQYCVTDPYSETPPRPIAIDPVPALPRHRLFEKHLPAAALQQSHHTLRFYCSRRCLKDHVYAPLSVVFASRACDRDREARQPESKRKTCKRVKRRPELYLRAGAHKPLFELRFFGNPAEQKNSASGHQQRPF